MLRNQVKTAVLDRFFLISFKNTKFLFAVCAYEVLSWGSPRSQGFSFF